MLTLEDKKKIMEQFPRGIQAKIAEKANVTRCSVSGWFRCNRSSLKIENAALDVVIEYKKEHESKLKEAGLR